jgi:hypothetical protein
MAQAAATVGVHHHALRRGDGDLRAAAPQAPHDLLGVVEDLDGGADPLVLQIALVLGEPKRDVEHGARHDGDAEVGRKRKAGKNEQQRQAGMPEQVHV